MHAFLRAFYIPIIFLTSLATQANPLRDSLVRQMANAKSDTDRVVAHYEYGDLLAASSKDSARIFYEKGKQLARHYGNKYAEAVAHGYEIALLNEEGKYAEALQICLDAAILFEQAKSVPKDLAVVHINIANELQYLSNYKKSLEHYFTALRYATEAKNLVYQALILSNLASLYAELGDDDSNIKYSLASKKVALAIKDDYRIFSAGYNLAEAYLSKKMLVEGRREIDSVKAVYARMGDKEYEVDMLMLEADYALRSGDTTQSAIFLNQILTLCQNNDFTEYEVVAAKELARIEGKAGHYKQAKKLIQQALGLATASKALKRQAELLIIYSDIEEQAGNFAAAIQLRKKYESISDSLAIAASHKNAQLLEIRFDTEKNQMQILQLTRETQIQQLKNRQRLWIIGGLLFGMACLAAFAFTQYKNLRHRQRLAIQEKALQQQKIEGLKTEQQLALAEERLRIAGDMHDDIGTTLGQIHKLATDMGNKKALDMDTLPQLLSLSEESLEKMNEMIWALHQGNQKIAALMQYISSQASAMAASANIDFVCELPGQIPDTTFTWKQNRNTWLLVKEAVGNAIKYSHASLIAIDWTIGTQLEIAVTDNGNGFDPATAPGWNNVLREYHRGAAALKGNVRVDTAIGQGTTIHFGIPLG